MYELPYEIINYCLLFADTGLRIVYCKNGKKHKLIYDFTHSKFTSLLRLLSQREIEIDDNITHIHLPWLFLSDFPSDNSTPFRKKFQKFFCANISIYNDCVLWNSHILYMKSNNDNVEKTYYITNTKKNK